MDIIIPLIFIIFWVIMAVIAIYDLKNSDFKIPKIAKSSKKKLRKKKKKEKRKQVNNQLKRLKRLIDESVINDGSCGYTEKLSYEEDNLQIAAILLYRRNKHLKVTIYQPNNNRYCAVIIDIVPDKPGLIKII